MDKALVYVASLLAIVSYCVMFIIDPSGIGFLYALLISISIATLSPFVGLLLAGGGSMSLSRYQVCVAVNVYAAAASLYMLYVEHPHWRLPLIVLSVVVLLGVALSEREKKGGARVRAVHRRAY